MDGKGTKIKHAMNEVLDELKKKNSKWRRRCYCRVVRKSSYVNLGDKVLEKEGGNITL